MVLTMEPGCNAFYYFDKFPPTPMVFDSYEQAVSFMNIACYLIMLLVILMSIN